MAKQVRIINATRGVTLAERAAVADNPWTRLRGLLGRNALPAGEALLIVPCNSVHCLFMTFPIDVAYLDRADRVLRLAPDLAPWRVGPIVARAHAVVELPAGALAASGTQAGDQLRIEALA